MLKAIPQPKYVPEAGVIFQATTSPLQLQRLFLISDLDKILTSG